MTPEERSRRLKVKVQAWVEHNPEEVARWLVFFMPARMEERFGHEVETDYSLDRIEEIIRP